MDRHRILIVEDSPTMRQLLAFALKRLRGAEIVEAQDGLDGLRKVTADEFDLALVDINMPVMDGLKLVHLIRQEPDLAEMPIVVITTEGAQEDRDRALAPWDGVFFELVPREELATAAREIARQAPAHQHCGLAHAEDGREQRQRPQRGGERRIDRGGEAFIRACDVQ